MKKTVLIPVIAIIAAAAVFGAVKLFSGNPTQKAGEVAGNFLTSFFAMEYDSAADLCSEELGSMLLSSVKAPVFPSESIGAKVAEASKGTTFKILSCEKTEEKHTVKVRYRICPFGGGAEIARSMTLVRIEGEWKISKLE